MRKPERSSRRESVLWGILWGVSVIFGRTAWYSVAEHHIHKPLVPQYFGAYPALPRNTRENRHSTAVNRPLCPECSRRSADLGDTPDEEKIGGSLRISGRQEWPSK